MQEPKKDESYRLGFQAGYQQGRLRCLQQHYGKELEAALQEVEKKLIKFVSRLSALEEEIAKIKKFLII